MILQRTAAERRAPVFAPLLHRTWLRRIAAAAGIAALVGASALWGLYEGMLLYRNRVATEWADLLDDVVATRLAIVPNLISGSWGSDAKRLVLDIKREHFQKLAYQRELALQRGVLITGGDDEWVPAQLRHGQESARVKVRLKGDWVDHLTGPKWSFRIKVRGEETLFGMKNFSLQHPKARRYVYEWAFFEALAREDLLRRPGRSPPGSRSASSPGPPWPHPPPGGGRAAVSGRPSAERPAPSPRSTSAPRSRRWPSYAWP